MADGKELWVANRDSNDVTVIDAKSRKVTKMIGAGKGAMGTDYPVGWEASVRCDS